MSSTTISSLALIKARFEVEQKDILDTLRPFIFYLLKSKEIHEFKSVEIKKLLEDEFGLIIPTHTISLLLNRLRSGGYIGKIKDVYRVDAIEDNIAAFNDNRAVAIEHQDKTINGFITFVSSALDMKITREDAETIMYEYLDQYSIECIKAYSTGSVVEVRGQKSHKNLFAISSYINYISENEPDKFAYFKTVVIGRMLANALLGEDLIDVKMKFHRTVIFLDTPIVLQILGVLGVTYHELSDEMLKIILESEGELAIFEHTLEEVDAVLKSAEKYLDVPGGRGNVIVNLRETGFSVSDLVLLRSRITDILRENKIQIISTPAYEQLFQIDDKALEYEMEKALLFYKSGVAKRADINSIRSIYTLRKGLTFSKLEKCKAILVTNNSAFAKAAYSYGKIHTESKEFSTVITDYSLINYIWLKSPMKHLELPVTMLTASCYGALKPSGELLEGFEIELNKLEAQGQISPIQHQFMRYDLKVRKDLMNLTLGGEVPITETHILGMLGRYEQELTDPYKREIEKLAPAKETLERVQSRIAKIAGYSGEAVRWSLFVLALTLYAFAQGWISPESTAHLPSFLKILLRVGIGVIAIFSMLNTFLSTTIWNPISILSKRIESFIARVFIDFLDIK